jgi:hypothetical protein
MQGTPTQPKLWHELGRMTVCPCWITNPAGADEGAPPQASASSLPQGAGLFCICPVLPLAQHRPGAGRAGSQGLGRPAWFAGRHFRHAQKVVRNHHHPKPIVVVPVVRVVPVANRTADVFTIVVERPAAQHPGFLGLPPQYSPTSGYFSLWLGLRSAWSVSSSRPAGGLSRPPSPPRGDTGPA